MLKRLQAKGYKRGFKRTPQRLAILDYLEGNTSHPSAEEVYRSVSRKYRSMSFATVYNTLNTLVDAGVVKDLNIDPSRRRYDPNTHPHHHLICMDCTVVVDVPDPISVEIPESIAGDYQVIGNHIEFYGYCSPCRKKKRPK